MKRHALFVATVLVVAGLGMSSAAAQAPRTGNTARVPLDADGDGDISRAEAAQSPRLAEHFAKLDRNGNGVLESSERPRHPARTGGRGGRGGHPGAGIERLDADADGRISRAEFDARKLPARSHRDGGKVGEALDFTALDANRDGYVVRTEWAAWQARMKPQREAEAAKRFDARFTEADLNRDGKLSRLEVDEKMAHAGKRFAWMDDNRDGFLSRAELKPTRR
ncbi:MAG TPA: hypothetical protein VLK29_01155 [Luteimonas sp.]|nr:hypothetical protein [Luteimonas sp.]